MSCSERFTCLCTPPGQGSLKLCISRKFVQFSDRYDPCLLVLSMNTKYCVTQSIKTILYSCSVDPRKLCVGVKYYIVHMYSMPYYTYGSIANFLFLGPTALIYIYVRIYMYVSKERRCNEDLRVGKFKIEQVIR